MRRRLVKAPVTMGRSEIYEYSQAGAPTASLSHPRMEADHVGNFPLADCGFVNCHSLFYTMVNQLVLAY